MKKPFSIEVKITDRCNQECPHCVNRDGFSNGRVLDWRGFNRRLEEWAGNRENSEFELKEVRLTGGEPLIDFDAVLGLVSCCRGLGIPSGINTNGLLLDADRIRLLKENGVETMKISLDAIRSDVYSLIRGPIASIEPLKDVIGILVAARFNVILRFTLTRLNRDQLLPCRDTAVELGVRKFQIKPLIRSGRAENLDAFLGREEVNAAIRELAEKNSGPGLSTEVLCWPPDGNGGFSYKICGSIDKIYVGSDGDVTICNYIRESEQASLGDIFSTPLETLFRRRLEENMHDSIDGNLFVKGCPNKRFFDRGTIR